MENKNIPLRSGRAKSSSSITTPFKTSIIGGMSSSRKLMRWFRPKTVPAASWYSKE